MEWRFIAFDALTVAELYAALRLRSAVFVVEQACLFPDMDGADGQAMHLLGFLDGTLVAYARCFPGGITFAEASIGRIVTHPSVRGSGAGHVLVERAISCLTQQWGNQGIRIGAQSRLQDFYGQHGFEGTGLSYLEDGIPHVEMLRPLQ